MTFPKPDTAYWERKLIAYLHDPLDKILKIQGHEERASVMLDKYGLQKPNEEFWKKADAIAAGFERGQVPSYNSDPDKNGAIDFLSNPVITHPTSNTDPLKILLDNSENNTAEEINSKLIEFIEEEIGMKAGEGGYSDKFSGDEERFALARFLYTHLILRFKLAEKNIGGLGALWHRLPADSRFPDHSIWQHNALCSALSSCIELSGDETEIGILCFSITPVQSFISKARKLRDYWTGSVLLSWLAFEGMKWVIENLGPDHIIYPSLIDQPLVNEYMKLNWKVSETNCLNPPKDIATFPNKFLVLVPMNKAEEIAHELEKAVSSEWMALSDKVFNTCIGKLGSQINEDGKDYIKRLFNRQNASFWDMQWAATYLVSNEDKNEIENLLPESVYKDPYELLDRFNVIIKDKPYWDKSGRGVLYSVSHSLAQSALAAAKNRKTIKRIPETGEKCHLCGEFEVIHDKEYLGDISAGEYKANTDDFWKMLKQSWDLDSENNIKYNLNKNEKLCSICLIKRMATEAIKETKDHILHNTLQKKDFPSTTDIALTNHFKREATPESERKEKAQKVHESRDDSTESSDRYYAILVMDGDKMGKLVNGETIASKWKTVIHPAMLERLKKPSFEKKYHDNWEGILDKNRLVTPAIHAAISESLGDFSLYGVARIVKKYNGTLIYAGGDDVCAVLPMSEALKAAKEIKDYYVSSFKLIKENESVNVSSPFSPTPGKLSVNLGNGDGISISAGILLCHHKESLKHMIEEAHNLLEEKAKQEAGRNACAIELKKRSGGSRFFVRRWSEIPAWESFSELGNAIKSKNKMQVSKSLVYRLEMFRHGIESILKHENRKEMLQKLIIKQLERSSVGDKESKEEFSERITEIIIDKNKDLKFNPEGLIIAAFMAEGGENK